jgi:hypothetical protein
VAIVASYKQIFGLRCRPPGGLSKPYPRKGKNERSFYPSDLGSVLIRQSYMIRQDYMG